MKSFGKKILKLGEHLILLDETFRKKSNYSSVNDYKIYKENLRILEKLSSDTGLKYSNFKIDKTKDSQRIQTSFNDEIYHQAGRQMKLADIIEYIFFSRGIFYLFQGDSFKNDRVKIYLEIILRYVNLLMVYEALTVDLKIRKVFLKNLEKLIDGEVGYRELVGWEENIGLPNDPENAPSEYFDSILPKTAGGLWHEMLVFAFALKYDIGYIFPLLLSQKPISLDSKLSPPDIVILHKKTFRYYGIEIGNLKERQTGGFSAPSGIPVIPIDTLNARVSDRCPTCKKWIGICPKVIQDFCNTDNPNPEIKNEIRCLIECEYFSLEDKLNGKCLYMKFSKKATRLYGINANFLNGYHYHYHCVLTANPGLIDGIRRDSHYDSLKELNRQLRLKKPNLELKTALQEELKSKFVFIKTHSIYYQELTKLIEMNK